jgi:hypothetical protein
MRRAKDGPPTDREPSWRTALAESDAAFRQVTQAAGSLSRLSDELRALREWAETTAQLELARDLTDGPDGGVLTALLATASDSSVDPSLRRTAEVLLERLISILRLEPIAARGEHLKLLPEELGEFEVRGRTGDGASQGHRELYCVVRPGWWLGARIVVRPLLEVVSADEVGGATCVGF